MIFVFISIILGDGAKRILWFMSNSVLPMFLSRTFITSGLTFRSSTRFELTFSVILVGCYFFTEGIFLTQGSNQHLLCLLQWQEDSLPLSTKWEAPVVLENVLISFFLHVAVQRHFYRISSTVRKWFRERWDWPGVWISECMPTYVSYTEVLKLFIISKIGNWKTYKCEQNMIMNPHVCSFNNNLPWSILCHVCPVFFSTHIFPDSILLYL